MLLGHFARDTGCMKAGLFLCTQTMIIQDILAPLDFSLGKRV